MHFQNVKLIDDVHRSHNSILFLFLALRYSMGEGDFKEDALKLNNALFNVRAIIKHFNPKIEQWLASNNLSTPTEEQILDIVKKNYDSLTLKLQDLLDHYERYLSLFFFFKFDFLYDTVFLFNFQVYRETVLHRFLHRNGKKYTK